MIKFSLFDDIPANLKLTSNCIKKTFALVVQKLGTFTNTPPHSVFTFLFTLDTVGISSGILYSKIMKYQHKYQISEQNHTFI